MASKRQSNEEKRALERAQADIYSDIRRAAEAHRYQNDLVESEVVTSCSECYLKLVVC